MTAQKPGVVVRVAVDALGGDRAPEVVVEGALAAAGDLLHVLLVGPEDALRELLPAGGHEHVEIVPAGDRIGSGDEPVEAVRGRPGSSLVVAARLLADDRADAFVSMGNTGAALAAGLLHVHRIKGVLRPALCTLLPAVPSPIVFLDAGANAEVRPEALRQFAVFGQVFAQEMLGIERPSVGLLSIGEEPTKGTQLVIEAHKLMAADSQINFYGNVEGRDLSRHTVDVIVADGFSGNIALKVFEGTARTIVGEIRNAVLGSLRAKIGAAIMSRDLQAHRRGPRSRAVRGRLSAGPATADDRGPRQLPRRRRRQRHPHGFEGRDERAAADDRPPPGRRRRTPDPGRGASPIARPAVVLHHLGVLVE